MSNVKLSIIVPVYNTERYCRECLVSLLDNDFSDLEVVVINDGSTDNSAEVIAEFADDSRLRMISQENGGLSYTRNVGIENARGEYCMFVDSDDKIYKNGISMVLDAIRNSEKDAAEILVIGIDTKEDVCKKRADATYYLEGEGAAHFLTRDKKTWPSVQFIVRKSFLEENNIRFKVGYLHEDVLWTTMLFTNATKVLDLNMICYYQREHRQGSITSTVNPKRVSDVWELVSIAQKIVLDSTLPLKVKRAILNRLAQASTSVLSVYKRCAPADQTALAANQMQFLQTLRYGTKMKIKVFRFLCRVFGLQRTIRLLRG